MILPKETLYDVCQCLDYGSLTLAKLSGSVFSQLIDTKADQLAKPRNLVVDVSRFLRIAQRGVDSTDVILDCDTSKLAFSTAVAIARHAIGCDRVVQVRIDFEMAWADGEAPFELLAERLPQIIQATRLTVFGYSYRPALSNAFLLTDFVSRFRHLDHFGTDLDDLWPLLNTDSVRRATDMDIHVIDETSRMALCSEDLSNFYADCSQLPKGRTRMVCVHDYDFPAAIVEHHVKLVDSASQPIIVTLESSHRFPVPIHWARQELADGTVEYYSAYTDTTIVVGRRNNREHFLTINRDDSKSWTIAQAPDDYFAMRWI